MEIRHTTRSRAEYDDQNHRNIPISGRYVATRRFGNVRHINHHGRGILFQFDQSYHGDQVLWRLCRRSVNYQLRPSRRFPAGFVGAEGKVPVLARLRLF